MGQQHPNIIVFFTDQQRWDTTGVHGNPLGLTPNFDRMAREGTHLARTFTCQPVCAPARSCLQTGQYATNTGVYRNEIGLRPDDLTLAHHFNGAGYDTAYIGKWHLAKDCIGPVPEAQRGGYRRWLASNLLENTSDAYKTVLYDEDGAAVSLPGYRVDALCDAAIRYIAEPRETPYFLFLSFLEPHHQNHLDDYPPPDGYRERYTGGWVPPDLAALGGTTQQHLAGYYGMVKRLDEGLGRVLDALKSLGALDNTVVLYTSDHGCHFKTRNDEYKRTGHESALRLPHAARGPGFDGGGQVRQLVSLIDLPPTLLDAAGIEVPGHMEGHSVLPLLRGGNAEWQDDIFAQVSESEVGRVIRTQRWKYGVYAPDAHGWDDSASGRYVEQYLYDLEYDPYELCNLIGLPSHHRVAEVLRGRLLRRMAAVGEAEPVVEPAAVWHDLGQRIVTEAEAQN